MFKIFFSFSLFFLVFYSCESVDASTKSINNSVNSFEKIDSKNENIFTTNERVSAYKSSINTKKSVLNKNKVYNGYGSVGKKTIRKEKKIEENNSKKSKINYSYKKKKAHGGASYSAYTTN